MSWVISNAGKTGSSGEIYPPEGTEAIIGTWNGKTLYRQRVSFPTKTMNNNNTITINDATLIVNGRAYINEGATSSNHYVSGNAWWATNDYFMSWCHANNFYSRRASPTLTSAVDWYGIVDYIK